MNTESNTNQNPSAQHGDWTNQNPSAQSDHWKKLFQKFCDETGLIYSEIVNDSLPADEQAYQMIKAIVAHANNGWKPNWEDINEMKYWPRFKMSSGFGFADTFYASPHTHTTVGARLCYKSWNVCIDTVQKYLPIYEKHYT